MSDGALAQQRRTLPRLRGARGFVAALFRINE